MKTCLKCFVQNYDEVEICENCGALLKITVKSENEKTEKGGTDKKEVFQ